MAKQSIIQRERKRERLVAKYEAKRENLRQILKSIMASEEEKWDAQVKLQKLPVDSSKSRLRKRCNLTGRPHGVYRKFGICRNKLRKSAMNGDVPGLTKASW
jgi:small subunit ribosomal protein S14